MPVRPVLQRCPICVARRADGPGGSGAVTARFATLSQLQEHVDTVHGQVATTPDGVAVLRAAGLVWCRHCQWLHGTDKVCTCQVARPGAQQVALAVTRPPLLPPHSPPAVPVEAV